MIRYTTTILKFGENGDKTGWTYIEVPANIAEELNPGVRKSYRVQVKLDQYQPEAGISLLPAGGGAFILPLNAAIRKAIAKKEGAMLQVKLELAKKPYQLDAELVACLEEDSEANAFFRSLPLSYQNYYSKWIQSAKTRPTRERRIVMAVASLARKESYAEMIRSSYKRNRLPG